MTQEAFAKEQTGRRREKMRCQDKKREKLNKTVMESKREVMGRESSKGGERKS